MCDSRTRVYVSKVYEIDITVVAPRREAFRVHYFETSFRGERVVMEISKLPNFTEYSCNKGILVLDFRQLTRYSRCCCSFTGDLLSFSRSCRIVSLRAFTSLNTFLFREHRTTLPVEITSSRKPICTDTLRERNSSPKRKWAIVLMQKLLSREEHHVGAMCINERILGKVITQLYLTESVTMANICRSYMNI